MVAKLPWESIRAPNGNYPEGVAPSRFEIEIGIEIESYIVPIAIPISISIWISIWITPILGSRFPGPRYYPGQPFILRRGCAMRSPPSRSPVDTLDPPPLESIREDPS